MTTHLRPGSSGPRLFLALLAALCAVIGTTALGTAPASAADQRRPIYAVAHRVNTLDGVDAALRHGANSIEIDVCAWWNPNEWRAYHDCSSAGDNRLGPGFDSMIDRILSHAGSGRRPALVWLDIKDPNYCGERENRGCSVAGLRDKAQRLTAAGIPVLYGFYEYHGGSTPDVGGRGWKSLEGRLGALEGITTTGTRDRVRDAFDRSGSGFPAGRRGMDYGDSDITKGFGNCTEATYYTVRGTEEGRRGP
ncbi:phospholipase [Streptomyces avidinii]|uniref:phospholipase n=1 Tax=Streptomyces avidinii TaxID=1895 RepID=UPI003869EA7C|nr:phospholipase [Streptomyces avidinii]WST50007.1 phospholipase [Streptomyces avidinii]